MTLTTPTLRLITWILVIALGALAWHASGWQGLALMFSALVLTLMLHYTRLMLIVRRAAQSPLGYVDSAVMLNARLKIGMTLMNVVALARALGKPLSAPDQQPEIYQWCNAGQSEVTACFSQGRLTEWQLLRPPTDDK